MVCVIACSGANAESFTLAHDGKSACRIALDNQVDQLNREVAEDFAGILQRMSGSEISQDVASGLKPVYLGEANDFPALPFPVPALEKEEFLLVHAATVHPASDAPQSLVFGAGEEQTCTDT